jgi:hypothetical protein
MSERLITLRITGGICFLNSVLALAVGGVIYHFPNQDFVRSYHMSIQLALFHLSLYITKIKELKFSAQNMSGVQGRSRWGLRLLYVGRNPALRHLGCLCGYFPAFQAEFDFSSNATTLFSTFLYLFIS